MNLLQKTTGLLAHVLWVIGVAESEAELANILAGKTSREIATILEKMFGHPDRRFLDCGLTKVRFFYDRAPYLKLFVEQEMDRIAPDGAKALATIQFFGDIHSQRIGLIALAHDYGSVKVVDVAPSKKDVERLCELHGPAIRALLDLPYNVNPQTETGRNLILPILQRQAVSV